MDKPIEEAVALEIKHAGTIRITIKSYYLVKDEDARILDVSFEAGDVGNGVGYNVYSNVSTEVELSDAASALRLIADALAEAEPTVTLHGTTGAIYEFAMITRIDRRGDGLTEVTGPCRRCHPQIDAAHSHAHSDGMVTESPAAITAAARAVWGATWSCPGCVEPVVVLPDTFGTARWRKITRIHREPYGIFLYGEWQHSATDEWMDAEPNGLMCDLTEAQIRAACAKAGVPCPPEEPPNPTPSPEMVDADMPVDRGKLIAELIKLRAKLDALAPDVAQKALEIAAKRLRDKCPTGYFSGETEPRCLVGKVDKPCDECWRAYLLEEARAFFAEQAGEAEEPTCPAS